MGRGGGGGGKVGGRSVHRLTHNTLAKTLFIKSEIISGENVKQVMHIWSQRCRQEPLLFEPAVATCYTRRIDHGAPPRPKAARGASRRNQRAIFACSEADTAAGIFRKFCIL